MGISISPVELIDCVARGKSPPLIDVRRAKVFAEASRMLPAARWRDHMTTAEWSRECGGETVVYCVYGHNVSQLAVAKLRALGINARFLEGGIEAWSTAGHPTVGKSGWNTACWVTRTRPKLDRIACPWFIRRFVDATAEILYVEPDQVLPVAEELGAIAFDVPGAPIEHDGPRCSFDTLLDHFAIDDKHLRAIAEIVRGADTDHLELAPEAAGLLAVSLGNSARAGSDEECLKLGFDVYDALYAWLCFAKGETHNWRPK